jgi:hypothetical protein
MARLPRGAKKLRGSLALEQVCLDAVGLQGRNLVHTPRGGRYVREFFTMTQREARR